VPLEEASHLLQASARWEGGQLGDVLPSLDRALTSRMTLQIAAKIIVRCCSLAGVRLKCF